MKLWELRDIINSCIQLHGINCEVKMIYPVSNRLKLGDITAYEVRPDSADSKSTVRFRINYARGEEPTS